ncbi:MAG: hypothetical protein WC529_01800 [Candidatus Margulisiibacteriota bacterium]
MPALAQTYYPTYWVKGEVVSDAAVSVNGRQVVLYESESSRLAGSYTSDTSGPTGASAQNARFLLNAYGHEKPFAEVGQTYLVAIPQGADGYGANPVPVVLTGHGIDTVSSRLVLAKGAGPGAVANPPVISDIRFGNRLYQKALVAKGEPFIVSSTPKISARVNSDSDVDTASIYIRTASLLAGTAPKTHYMSGTNIMAKSPETGGIRSMSLSYNIPETDKLAEGENEVVIAAANSAAATSETCTVTVLGGPLKVIGPVVFYPQPFSSTKHRRGEIQYTLSQDAEIEIYLLTGSGQTMKKLICPSGTDGGSAGVNKVGWDGTTDLGPKAGNGVYVGTIVSRLDGKLLAKFKFSIVD